MSVFVEPQNCIKMGKKVNTRILKDIFYIFQQHLGILSPLSDAQVNIISSTDEMEQDLHFNIERSDGWAGADDCPFTGVSGRRSSQLWRQSPRSSPAAASSWISPEIFCSQLLRCPQRFQQSAPGRKRGEKQGLTPANCLLPAWCPFWAKQVHTVLRLTGRLWPWAGRFLLLRSQCLQNSREI